MAVDELRHAETEPSGLSNALAALWCDVHGEWNKAHHLVQDDDGRDAAWVHAYLHRKEGDETNARYWYARARRESFYGTLEEELVMITAALLDPGAVE